MPLTLAIESSNPSAPSAGARGGPGIALGDATTTLGVELLAPTDRSDDDLMPAIDRLMRRLSLAPRDLRGGAVAVSIGPGGYTALRVAVATAKMICEATGAACIAIPTANIIARRALSPSGAGAPLASTQPFAVALASKGDSTHITTFDSRGRATAPGRLITADDVAALSAKMILSDNFLPAPIRDAARQAHIEILPPHFDPAACLEESRETSPIDAVSLAPLYPREPEAVTQWRRRHTS